jgi:hypothetical protein
MKIKPDLFGNIPKVGDVIGFNPPRYKGLVYGTIIGFSKSGCPHIGDVNTDTFM